MRPAVIAAIVVVSIAVMAWGAIEWACDRWSVMGSACFLAGLTGTVLAARWWSREP